MVIYLYILNSNAQSQAGQNKTENHSWKFSSPVFMIIWSFDIIRPSS